MKKAIASLGVVAGLAVVLAPVATFAADATYNSDEHTDTLNVTVLPTCAFGAANADPVVTGVAHNAASATPLDNSTNAASWTTNDTENLGMTPDAAEQDEHKATDVATYSIYAGTADDNMGTTTLTVVCNQGNGYKIKVTAGTLDLSGATSISPISAPSASTTGYKITTAGTADTIAPVVSTTETEAVVKNSASAATGDAFTFTYSIGIAPGTTAGTYTGDVVYTLVQQLGA